MCSLHIVVKYSITYELQHLLNTEINNYDIKVNYP